MDISYVSSDLQKCTLRTQNVLDAISWSPKDTHETIRMFYVEKYGVYE